ncbi:MAG TPA: bifunctional DedA family/phosphatase PAP2 family protein [Acidimicrobiales bacterium]|nr:bifunctional DedA family/phosphatase PAP2 family protein [Acidimicrobiales bacterium]
MIAGLLDHLASLASPWGYVVVGMLAMLEASAFVGLVVPGEAALLVGGFLVSQGRATLAIMIAAAVVGAIVGDSIGYEVGRHLGPSLRRSRVGRWVGEQRWERTEAYLQHHGGRAVFLGRFVGVLRAMVPTIAGLSQMPYRTFLPWNAAGGLVWAPTFVLIGYVAGGSYHRVADWAGKASTVLAVLVLLVVAVVFAARAVVRREGVVRRWARAQAERPQVVRLHDRFERQLAYLGRRLQPHAASGLSLTSGLLGVVVVGWAFGIVVRDVISRHELAGVDGSVYRFFLDHRTGTLTQVSRVVSHLGDVPVLAVVTLGVAALVWSRTHQARAILLPALSVIGSVALVELVKVSVHRPAPPTSDMLAGAPGFAFPSSQATASAACLLTAAFLAWGVLRSWRSKILALTAAVSLSLLVGLVGLALGVHWLTDVLGGWALGVLWFAIIAVVSDVAATLHHRDPAPLEPPPEKTAVNR